MSATIFTVKRSEVEGRLDPGFYNPKYFEVFKKKNVNWSRLTSITESLKHPPEYKRVFAESGYQLIRSQNVRPTGINLSENPVYLSKEVVDNCYSIFPKKGDILVVRSGVNAGDVAVVEKDFINTTIGADTLLLNVTSEVLPKFVQIYFYTDVGRNQLNRYITGATNKHINSFSLKRVYFPKIDLNTQQQCIRIFEISLSQKQQKQQKSKELLDSIDTYLLSELGITLPRKDNSLSKRIFTTKFSEVSGGRWDCPSNLKKFTLLSHKFLNTKLSDVITINPYVTFPKGVKDITFIPMEAINETYAEIDQEYVKPIEECSGFTRFMQGDLIWAKITPCMQNGKSAVVKNTLNGFACGSTEFFIIRCNPDKIFVDYLSNILHIKEFLEYATNFFGGNAGQQRVAKGFLLNLFIPLPPLSKQKEIAEHIHRIRTQAKQLQIEAEQILKDAKLQIEKMILGE